MYLVSYKCHKREIFRSCSQRFTCKYLRARIPVKWCVEACQEVASWVRSWLIEREFKGSVLTEEDVHGIKAWVKKEHISQIIKMRGTINWAIYSQPWGKLIFTHTEMVLRGNKEPDCTTAVHFCYSFLQNIWMMAVLLQFVTSEAWHYLSGLLLVCRMFDEYEVKKIYMPLSRFYYTLQKYLGDGL
jgi:hypothetical protein